METDAGRRRPPGPARREERAWGRLAVALTTLVALSVGVAANVEAPAGATSAAPAGHGPSTGASSTAAAPSAPAPSVEPASATAASVPVAAAPAAAFVTMPLPIPDAVHALLPLYLDRSARHDTILDRARELAVTVRTLDARIEAEAAAVVAARTEIMDATARVRALAAAQYRGNKGPPMAAFGAHEIVEVGRRMELASAALDAQQQRLAEQTAVEVRTATALSADRGDRDRAASQLRQDLVDLAWWSRADTWIRRGTADDLGAAALPGSALTVDQLDASLRASRVLRQEHCEVPWAMVAALLTPTVPDAPAVAGTWLVPAETTARTLCAAGVHTAADFAAFVAATGLPADRAAAIVSRFGELESYGLPTVTRNAVLVIGDSLTVGAESAGVEDQLRAAGWEPTVDGKIGRRTDEAMVRLAAHDGEEWAAVVIALGTNDASDAAGYRTRLAAVLDRLPGVPVIVVPPAWSRVAPLVPAAVELADARPQLRVTAWPFAVAQHPEWVGPDGVHYSAAGYAAYATDIVDALTR